MFCFCSIEMSQNWTHNGVCVFHWFSPQGPRGPVPISTARHVFAGVIPASEPGVSWELAGSGLSLRLGSRNEGLPSLGRVQGWPVLGTLQVRKQEWLWQTHARAHWAAKAAQCGGNGTRVEDPWNGVLELRGRALGLHFMVTLCSV